MGVNKKRAKWPKNVIWVYDFPLGKIICPMRLGK